MALSGTGLELGDVVAGADLSSSQFCLVKLSTSADRTVVLAAGNSDVVVGVLGNKPISGAAADVQTHGEAKVQYGGSVTRGDALMSDASAHAVTQSSTNPKFGYALESGSSGEVHSVLLISR